jgi:hypothetical protein
MRHVLRIVMAVAAAGLAFAAPASADADTNGYLQAMVPQYTFLTPQQLLSAAGTVCSATQAGKTSADIVQQLQKEFLIGVPEAVDITRAAVVYFDC